MSLPSNRRRTASLLRWARPLAAVLVLAIAPLAALATYPGVNGKIAYTDVVDAGSPEERRAVFIHGRDSSPTPSLASMRATATPIRPGRRTESCWPSYGGTV